MTNLKDLQSRIDAAQKAREDKNKQDPAPSNMNGMNAGMRILTELIGIMIACGGIGYFLDYMLGTAPGFLLGMLVLGMVTFFYKLIKMTRG